MRYFALIATLLSGWAKAQAPRGLQVKRRLYYHASVLPGVYTLQNVNSGKYLNVAGGATDDGANVQVWDNPDAPETQWEIRPITASAFSLKNVGSGKYLDVAEDGSKWDNVIVRGSVVNDLWNIDEVSVDTYAVRSLIGGMSLNVLGGLTSNGANVILWDNPQSNHSEWQLQRLRALPGVQQSSSSSATSTTITTTEASTTYTETVITTTTQTLTSTTNPYHVESEECNECSPGYERIADEATCSSACAAVTQLSYQRAWKWPNDPVGCFAAPTGCYFNKHATGASHPTMHPICQISANFSGSEQ